MRWTIFVFIIFSITILTLLVINEPFLKHYDRVGAVAEALFTAAAFLGLLFALHFQNKDLSLQREELSMQREEIKLQRLEMEKQSIALENSSEQLRSQANMLEKQTNNDLLSSILELHANNRASVSFQVSAHNSYLYGTIALEKHYERFSNFMATGVNKDSARDVYKVPTDKYDEITNKIIKQIALYRSLYNHLVAIVEEIEHLERNINDAFRDDFLEIFFLSLNIIERSFVYYLVNDSNYERVYNISHRSRFQRYFNATIHCRKVELTKPTATLSAPPLS